MGFFFNLDARIMKFIEKHANDRDLKSIRFMAILFLELWKEEFVNEYGLEAWNELYKKYHITNEDEGRINKKKKIEVLKVLGFSEDDAEIVCTMSKEDLKLYVEARKQKNWNDQNEIPKQKREDGINELLVERERLQKRLPDCPNEQNKKWTENRIEEINRELKAKGVANE